MRKTSIRLTLLFPVASLIAVCLFLYHQSDVPNSAFHRLKNGSRILASLPFYRRNEETSTTTRLSPSSSTTAPIWPIRSFEQLTENLAHLKSRGKFNIPKVLHQSWKNQTLPPKYAIYRRNWIHTHPSWIHYLWTDEENRELLRRNYPWFLPYYDDFPIGVMRADSMRYIYMHRFGGVYADLDTEPLKPIDVLIDNATTPVIVAYLGTDYTYIHNIPPGFLISEPGHVLWMLVIRAIMRAVKNHPKNTRPEVITGPVVLYEAIQAYSESGEEKMMFVKGGPATWSAGSVTSGSNQVGDITIYKPGVLYPIHWREHSGEIGKICQGTSPNHNETACKKLFPDSYTIMYHSWSWEKEWDRFAKNFAGR